MSIASLVNPVYSFKISASNQPVFLLHPLSLVWNLFSSSLIWEQNPDLLPWLMSHLMRVLKREDPKAWFWKHKVTENGVLGAQEKQEKHKTTRPWIQETQEARNNEKTQSLRSTKTMDTANKSKHPGNKTQADRLQAAIREDQDSGVTHEGKLDPTQAETASEDDEMIKQEVIRTAQVWSGFTWEKMS